MGSVILQLASKYIKYLMVLFSIFVLIRGHNYPGGGFIGGIVAGTGILFDALANTVSKSQEKLTIKPINIIGIGILIAFLAAITGPLSGDPLLTGKWIKPDLPLIGMVKLGSPLLFDTGVYFVVTGSFITMFFSIMEEIRWT
jgi:multicomponent Na+:H+ antiporter subunit B